MKNHKFSTCLTIAIILLSQFQINCYRDHYWQNDDFNFLGNLKNFDRNFYGHRSSHQFYQDMKDLLQELINNNRDDEVTSEVLYNMQEVFAKEAHSKYGQIMSTLQNINPDEDIIATAGGEYNKNEHHTHAQGQKITKHLERVVVSGAKGTTTDKEKIHAMKIQSLSLSELIESFQNGITAAFVQIDAMDQYFMDAKVNEDEDSSKINMHGQWEITDCKSQKYLIHEKKTALGVTRMYRLLIGKDYLRLIENYLTAGASAEDKKVKSKSSIRVQSQIAHKKDKDIVIKVNVGYFTSENQTDKQTSVSKHRGYLKVQKDDGIVHKNTLSYANIKDGQVDTDSFYAENKD